MVVQKQHKLNKLSVFFPAYNEGKNIAQTVEKARVILPKIAKKWEILVINDGSKDETEKEVKRLMKKYPHDDIRLISHKFNRGYGAALKSGLYGARYAWIAFTDSDGQFDFNDIRKLIDKQKKTGADVVIGYYKEREVPLYRIWGSKLWELAVWILFGLKVRDIDCGFKLIRKKVVDTIPPLEAERGPFISSEFLIQAKKANFKITEEGVGHYPRREGEATGSSLKVVLSGFKDLLRFWFKLHFS